jgi:hypothetical protein
MAGVSFGEWVSHVKCNNGTKQNIPGNIGWYEEQELRTIQRKRGIQRMDEE